MKKMSEQKGITRAISMKKQWRKSMNRITVLHRSKKLTWPRPLRPFEDLFKCRQITLPWPSWPPWPSWSPWPSVCDRAVRFQRFQRPARSPNGRNVETCSSVLSDHEKQNQQLWHALDWIKRSFEPRPLIQAHTQSTNTPNHGKKLHVNRTGGCWWRAWSFWRQTLG